MAPFREWLRVPEMLQTIIDNQENLMAQNARVLVLTEKIAAQNAAEAQLANAALIDNANLRKTVGDLRAELEANSVSTDSLDALEAAINDGGKTAEALVKLADPAQETPPVGSLPDPTPLPGAEPVETLPVPDAAEEAPGVPTPGGESTPADAGTGTDASGTVPSGTPVVGATEPSVVPPAPEAPPVPTDADGNSRVENNDSGVVDNSDGYLADAPTADVAPVSDTTVATDGTTSGDTSGTSTS